MDNEGKLQSILDWPDRFYCERAKCDIKLSVCIGRQKANTQRRPFEVAPFGICEDCRQGQKNREGEHSFPEGIRPKRGKGERKEDCNRYGECLSFVAKRDWKTWNCEECPTSKGAENMETEKPDRIVNTRICEDCGKEPTIRPTSPYCPRCTGKRGNQNRKPGRKARKGRAVKRRDPGQCQRSDRGAIVPLRPDLEVLVSFSRHPEILDRLKALAEKEIRPLDLQVIYLLKKSLIEEQETS